MYRMKDLTFRIHISGTILALVVLSAYPAISQTSTAFALSGGNETDRLALLAFKDRITEDPLGILNSWSGSDHCIWTGISCSEQYPGRVTVLDLEGQKLTGSIPPHVGNLSFLTGINLENNSFKGKLPQELGLLSNLRYLNLSTNAFEGEIPKNLTYCLELEIINLNRKNLVGEIPHELSSLVTKKLKSFRVSKNDLSGEIPLWLGNASSLTFLSMADNMFQGSIPVGLGKLKNLQLLQIAGNNLTGKVPLSIYNISSLLHLDMGDNQLHGHLPSDVGITLPNLIGIYIGQNWFMGSFPASLVNASGLEIIDFSQTNLTGTLPTNLGSLKELSILSISNNMFESTDSEGLNFLTSLTNCSLQEMDIGYNRFQGKLPSSIGNFTTNLEWLVAEENQISGKIPKEIEHLTGLTRFALSSNLITGEIPVGIGNLKRMQDLRLYGNQFSGKIPPSLGNLTLLYRLELHTNNLSGNIPASLGDCRQLEQLLLYGNKLAGVIPKEVANISSISLAFNLANNSLTGPLPMEIGDMNNLYELDVSENKLTGEIPFAIGYCTMLEKLSLQGNFFGGQIPSALSSLRSLHFLDISRNNFSGKIPAYLQNLTFLQNVNLSFNNLEGEIPEDGVFKNTSAFSIAGNSKLCGGIESLGLPSCEISGSKENERYLATKIAIPVAIALIIMLVCVFVYLCKRRRSEDASSSTMLDTEEKFTKVSYNELLQATNNFSPFNLIGEGQYGSVYKGILGNNETDVAVKVINLTKKGAAKSFMSECNALRNIRHRNLIKIITACSSIDSKGADFKALVFKFVPNGSLEQWLHIHEGKQGHQRSLSFNQRLNIAIDVASALEYLHHHCQIPMVHGDLKPSNILIDYDMVAQVGDFGLARSLSDIQSHSAQQEACSTGIRGTVGYVAPEFGMGSKASKKGDVYSFGILLLEMFTGRRPTASLFENGLTLHQFTSMALPGKALEIIEPSLLPEFRDDKYHVINIGSNPMQASNFHHCLVEILKIGVLCSMESPAERMDMGDVVKEMSEIRKNICPDRN